MPTPPRTPWPRAPTAARHKPKATKDVAPSSVCGSKDEAKGNLAVPYFIRARLSRQATDPSATAAAAAASHEDTGAPAGGAAAEDGETKATVDGAGSLLREAEAQLLQEMRDNLDGLLVAQASALHRFLQRLEDNGLPLREDNGLPLSHSNEDLDGMCAVPSGLLKQGDFGVASGSVVPQGSLDTAGSAVPRQGQLDPQVEGSFSMEEVYRRKFTVRKDIQPTPSDSRGTLHRTFKRFSYWAASLEEPQRTGRLATLERNPWFEMTTLLVIMLNFALVVFQTDRDGRKAMIDPAMAPRQGTWVWELTLEFACSAYFVLELTLRLFVHKLYFFCNTDWFWDILDFVTVIVTLIDYAMLSSGSSNNSHNRYLRFFRGILRMTKSLRIFHTLNFVRPLRQTLECIFSSLSGVFWCIMLIAFVTLISATFLCQCLTSFIENEWTSEETTPAMEVDLAMLHLHFGSVWSASFSLFEAISDGNWVQHYTAMSLTGMIAPTVLIMYILFFLIAFWNVFTSLFVEKMLALSRPDEENQLMEKRKKDLRDTQDLMALVEGMDMDQHGLVSLSEFKRVLCQPSIYNFLESRDIDVKDAEMFFRTLQLSSGSDELDQEIVVGGLLRMRGMATNMDLQAIQFQVQMQSSNQRTASASTIRQLSRITAMLEAQSKGMALGVPRPCFADVSKMVVEDPNMSQESIT